MAHIEKYTRAQVGGLTRHFERAKNTEGEYIQFGNQEIDLAKTDLNYNLAPEQNQLEFIKQRTKEVKCLKRDDVNVMCNWVVTAPKTLTDDDELTKKFFKDTYEFLKAEHGEKNIISAHVHMDESAPHMHFAFVPVVMARDKKKGIEIEKVRAKDVVTRDYLKTFHTRFNQYMEQSFGFDIGVLNGATANGNLSITELKLKNAQDKLSDLENNVLSEQGKADALVRQGKALRGKFEGLQAEYKAKQAYITACDKESDISLAIPAYAEVKERGILNKTEFVTVPKEKWLAKHVSANEKEYLKKATRELEKSIATFKVKTSAQYLEKMENAVVRLDKELSVVKSENRALISEVKSAKNETDKFMDRIHKTLDNLPDELAHQFVERWNKEKAIEQNHSHDHSYER